jgi:hypothetical protein
MKQRFWALALAFCLLLCGCGDTSAPSSSSSSDTAASRTVTGKVKSVSGNELELAIGTLGSGQGSPSGEEEEGDDGVPSRGGDHSSRQGDTPGGRPSGGEMEIGGGMGGEMPSGFPGAMGGMAGSGGAVSPAIQLTGEVETISPLIVRASTTAFTESFSICGGRFVNKTILDSPLGSLPCYRLR